MGMGDGGLGNYDELIVSLRLKYDQFRQQLNSEMELAKKEIKSLEPALNDAEKGFGKVGQMGAVAMGAVIGLVSQLTGLLINASGQIIQLASNFVSGGLQINASMQQMQIAFTTILGSEEAAVGFIQKLRKEAALIGANAQEFAQIGKSLLPYAKGDLETFESILHVAEQLAVIDPVAGIKGAGFALRELLSGNVRSLAMRFELPVSELNKFKKEFEETGDIDLYISRVADLAEQFGAAKDAVAQMSGTAIGKIRQMEFQISEIQRILTAPLFEVLQKKFGEFATFFMAHADEIKASALRVGAVIAAFVDVAVSFGKVVIQTVSGAVQIASGLLEQINIIFDAIQKMVVEKFGDLAVWASEGVANIVNSVIETLNKAIEAVGGQKIDLIKIDKDKIRKDAEDAMNEITEVIQGKKTIDNKIGEGIFGITGLDIGKQFNNIVDAYEAMFKDLLEETEFALESQKEAHEEFTEEDLALWQDALANIGEEIERYNAQIEEEAQKHQEKLDDIAADAERSREKARRKAREAENKENASAKQQALEIEQEANLKAEDIEREYQENIKKIREQADEDLFDAINARDARRIYEILNNAKKEHKGAKENRDNQLAENARNKALELQQLQISHAQKIKEIKDSLRNELKEIDVSEKEKRQEEIDSYRKRLADLNKNFQERLKALGKALAAEGKIEAEGLQKIMQALGLVYGPNGSYLSLMDGFNAQLKLRAQQTAAILAASGQAPTPTYTPPYIPPEERVVRGRPIATATGFNGVVSTPTLFLAGEGGSPEIVKVIPRSSPGYREDALSRGNLSGGEQRIHVTVDARGVSAEFEAQVADTVSRVVGRAVNTGRRTKRR